MVDEDEVVRVDSNLVIIPASVVDERGRAITDLKVEDFELKVDGEVKPIGELTRAETPVHVALLFDNSASLSAAREFEKQAAVRFFQSVVRPIDRAAVYSISTVPTLAQGLTNDVPAPRPHHRALRRARRRDRALRHRRAGGRLHAPAHGAQGARPRLRRDGHRQRHQLRRGRQPRAARRVPDLRRADAAGRRPEPARPRLRAAHVPASPSRPAAPSSSRSRSKNSTRSSRRFRSTSRSSTSSATTRRMSARTSTSASSASASRRARACACARARASTPTHRGAAGLEGAPAARQLARGRALVRRSRPDHERRGARDARTAETPAPARGAAPSGRSRPGPDGPDRRDGRAEEGVATNLSRPSP